MTEQHSVFPSEGHGTVSNYVSGNVGSLVQAGNVTGGITMGSGPGGIQIGGVDAFEARDDRDLLGDLTGFLDRISGDDLGERSREAAALAARLRAQAGL